MDRSGPLAAPLAAPLAGGGHAGDGAASGGGETRGEGKEAGESRASPGLGAGDDFSAAYRRNVRICMWISFCSTLTTQMAAGAFVDIYMFKVSGSNGLVGAVESARGVAQLLAAPLLGVLTDRMCRYRLARLQAVSRALPVALLALAVASDEIRLLFVAVPLFAVSNHFGSTVRGALMQDCLEDGSQRTRALSRNFSLQYVGQAAAPMLQALVLLCVGGLGAAGADETWQLPELRLTLVAGCLTYLAAEPASFAFRRAPPAVSAPAPSSAGPDGERLAQAGPLTGDGLGDWRQERVCRCLRGGWRKMWAIPILVEATFVMILVGSGLSVKFFPLFFVREFRLSPLGLCLLNVAEPLGVAAATSLNPWATRRLGAARYAVVLMVAAPLLLLGLTFAPWFPLVAPLFVLRTAVARSYIPLYQDIVFTCAPAEHRGKFSAMSAFRLSFFSASAFLGSWLADAYGSYRPAFLVTAVWQGACVLMFLPVVAWMPRVAGGR